MACVQVLLLYKEQYQAAVRLEHILLICSALTDAPLVSTFGLF